MAINFSFALMSGGEGRRFGEDKTKALLNGKPLYLYGIELGLSLSQDVMHVSRNVKKYEPFSEHVRYLEDVLPNQCPMAGMITAAQNAIYDHIFILSADAPLFSQKAVLFLMSQIGEYDAVIPVIKGKYYNLAAMYTKKMLLDLESSYKTQIYKLTESYKKYNILFINESTLIGNNCLIDSFANINTKSDLEIASSLINLK